jgi:hypothetical protein
MNLLTIKTKIMFNFSKKQQGGVSAATEYPNIVQEVHREFLTAGDKILAEAELILADENKKSLDKGKRLAAIGFAMWVHFNWQHLGDKFFLQKDGLALYTIEEIEKTAITREEMYELYQQSKQ